MSEGEVEHFHDYTVATAWEKFVASLEHCLHFWSPQGSGKPAILQAQHGARKLEAHLQHRLPFRSDAYILTLLPPHPPLPEGDGAGAPPLPAPHALCDQPHKLQEWFGSGPCLLLAPDSYSGRILDDQEAHTLLSAGALALAHQKLRWPLLIPVQDALRDAYQGVAVGEGGGAVLLDTDSLHTSRLRTELLQMEEQLGIFASRLFPICPASAAACRAALHPSRGSDVGLAAMAAAAVVEQAPRQGGPPARPCTPAMQLERGGGTASCEEVPWRGAGGAQLRISIRRSYEVPCSGSLDEEELLLGGEEEGPDWDAEAPWRPWAAEYDPVGCLELDVVARYDSATSALAAEAAGGPPSPTGRGGGRGCEWRLTALRQGYERDNGQRGFAILRVSEKRRQFLRLQSILPTGPPAEPQHPAALSAAAAEAEEGLLPGASADLAGWEAVGPEAMAGAAGFYGMLSALQDSCRWVVQAHAVDELGSENWWMQRGAYLPTTPAKWVLQDMLRDILAAPGLPPWPGPRLWGLDHRQDSAAQDGEHGGGGTRVLGKGAPLWSLVTRFTLHCLVMGSPRAAALLWTRLVRELRFAHWDTLTPLNRMDPPQHPLPHHSMGSMRSNDASSGSLSVGGGGGEGGAAGAAAVDGREGRGGEEGGGPPPVDLTMCLIHQKLQLLQLCIQAVRQQRGPAQGQGHRPADPVAAGGRGGGAAKVGRLGRQAGQGAKGDDVGMAGSSSGAARGGRDVSAGGKSEWEWDSWGGFSEPATPKTPVAPGTAAAEPAGGGAEVLGEGEGWVDGNFDAGDVASESSSYHSAAEEQPLQGSPSPDRKAGGGGSAQAGAEAPRLRDSAAAAAGSPSGAAQEAGGEAVAGAAAPARVDLGLPDGTAAPAPPAPPATSAAADGATHIQAQAPGEEARGLREAGAAASVWGSPSARENGAALVARGSSARHGPASACGRLENDGAVEAGREGVAGYLAGPGLLHHPSRRLAIPITQVLPPCTEDVLLERELAMRALHLMDDSQGAAPQLRAQVQGALLSSDMSAFRAANPGACLEDFVRWHSPRDWEGGRLSGRMAEPGNEWARLWEAAPAAPASRQRPLFDPVLEGERALHFLETLPPALLFGDLLSVGLSAAVGLLGKSPGAGLPAVKRELDRLREVCASQLQSGVAICPTPTPATPAPSIPHAPSAGSQLSDAVSNHGSSAGGGSNAASRAGSSSALGALDPGEDCPALPPLLRQLYQSALSLEGYGALLRMLGCVEHSVAAGQSLLQRLTPPADAASPACQAGASGAGGFRGGKALPGTDRVQPSSHGTATAEGSTGPDRDPSPFALAAAGALAAAALGQASEGAAAPGTACPFGTVWVVPPDGAEREGMAALMRSGKRRDVVVENSDDEEVLEAPDSQQMESMQSGQASSLAEEEQTRSSSGGASLGAGAGAAAERAAAWPRPFLREWLYEVGEQRGDGVGGEGVWSAQHRMYVKALPAELRVATRMVCGGR